MQDADVVVITCGGTSTGEDRSFTQIQLAGKKKVQLNFDHEKETLVEMHDVIRRDMGKLPIYEIPTSFDSTSIVGPS